MHYVSTRGAAPVLQFDDVLLAGLARDGGLYLPEVWPRLSRSEIRDLRGLPYAELATRVMRPFIGRTIPEADFEAIVTEAYAGFGHEAVAPLKQLGHNRWLMELFHGPTLSFKDYALQVVGRLFDHVLKAKGQRVTIVGATSGDTGSAAIEACRDRDAIDIFILHPKGRVSDVQRRQMTTVDSPNVHNLAVEGTFDDCQDLVKAMFNETAFRDRFSLSAVNSINWARIMVQIAYYFAAAVALGAPDRRITFSVPTGNFGNVFAAYGARQMGLGIPKLVHRLEQQRHPDPLLQRRRMETAPVVPTLSPSMDIQISSNFERLLFEYYGRQGRRLAPMMERFRKDGTVDFGQSRWQRMRKLFSGHRLDDTETRKRDPPGFRDDRRNARSAQHHRLRRRRDPGRSARLGDGRHGHRPSGQVPRCGRGGHRRQTGTAAAPRRSVRARGTLRRRTQRRRGREGPHRRATGRERSSMTIQISRLANGLTVASDAMDSVETASVGVWVGVGTRDEMPEVNGVSHLLEHMAFKGTRRRSAQAIAEEIEAVGGHLNAYTSREHTAYYAKVLKEDLPLALDLLADILQNSTLDSEELARERTVIVQEIHQSLDTPDDIVFDHFQATAFPDQPIGRPVMGSSDLIRNMPRESVVDFMRGHYGATSMTLTAAGRVDHDDLMRLAEDAFGGLAAGQPVVRSPVSYVGGDFRETRDIEQVHVLFGLEGIPYTDDDFYALSVLSHPARRRHVVAPVPGGPGKTRTGLHHPVLPFLLYRRRSVRHLCRHRRAGGRGTGSGGLRRVAQGRRGGQRRGSRPSPRPAQGEPADGPGKHVVAGRAAGPPTDGLRPADPGRRGHR